MLLQLAGHDVMQVCSVVHVDARTTVRFTCGPPSRDERQEFPVRVDADFLGQAVYFQYTSSCPVEYVTVVATDRYQPFVADAVVQLDDAVEHTSWQSLHGGAFLDKVPDNDALRRCPVIRR